MNTMFYLTEVNPYPLNPEFSSSWLVRVRDTHFTLVSVETKERALECLFNLIVRAGSTKALFKSLSRIERDNQYRFASKKENLSGRVSPETLKRWEEERVKGAIYDEEVNEVVAKALKEISFNQPVHTIRKKAKRLTLSPTSIKEEEKVDTKVTAGKILIPTASANKKKILKPLRVKQED